MRLPRDVKATALIKLLEQFGYLKIRQTGSHIRMEKIEPPVHKVTIPNHNPVRIGTLNKILNDVSLVLKINKSELIEKL